MDGEYEIEFKPTADKALRKLPKKAQVRIVERIEELKDDPRPPGCIELEGDDGLLRIRVGKYRVVYTIEDEQLLVLVVRVAHRKDAYREL